MQKDPVRTSSLQIYCDFDGTITNRDSFDYLLETLALPGWMEIETQWENDEISARECMRLQTALIPGPWSQVIEALKNICVDPTFPIFAKWCRDSGIALY